MNKLEWWDLSDNNEQIRKRELKFWKLATNFEHLPQWTCNDGGGFVVVLSLSPNWDYSLGAFRIGRSLWRRKLGRGSSRSEFCDLKLKVTRFYSNSPRSGHHSTSVFVKVSSFSVTVVLVNVFTLEFFEGEVTIFETSSSRFSSPSSKVSDFSDTDLKADNTFLLEFG